MRNSKYIADKIRSLRRQKKLSQEQLAELAGLTVGAITRIETNVRIPKIDTLMKIAKVLGASTDDILQIQAPKTIEKRQTMAQENSNFQELDLSSIDFSGRVLSALAGLQPFHRDFVLALTLKDFSFLEKYKDSDVDEVFQEILKYS